MAYPRTSLKLLVDRRGRRVLFAEVPKEFVDFLFHMFSLPLGTLIEFLGSDQMVGSLGKLKESIARFERNYLQPGIVLKDVLNPKTTFNGNTFLMSYDHAFSKDQSGVSKDVYRCANASVCEYGYSFPNKKACKSNATLYENSVFPSCNRYMNVPMTLVIPKEVLAETKKEERMRKRGFVKEVVTYMVTDDLVVKPMSAISSITLINKFGVKDLSQLEEETVSFGKEEGLKLLKASLKTNKVLTAMFFN